MNNNHWKANNSLREVLVAHDRRYPGSNEQDLYKLIFQAVMGNEHAVTDQTGISRWMEEELRTMGEGPEERLLDPISAEGNIVRVHLRPMVKAGLDSGVLLKAFLQSASIYHGSLQILQSSLTDAEELANTGGISVPADKARNFFRQMQEDGYPAVHHSESYEKLYRPAYRVVMKAAIPLEFGSTMSE